MAHIIATIEPHAWAAVLMLLALALSALLAAGVWTADGPRPRRPRRRRRRLR